MGSSDAAWRRRLLDACDRTLADLARHDDRRSVDLIADIREVRDRLRRDVDADRGPSRSSKTDAATRAPDPSGK